MITLPHPPARRPLVKTVRLQEPTTAGRAGARETFTLAKGGLRSWALASGETVHLTSGHGHAWVSREGDPEDYVLGPNGPLYLAGPGLVVLEALEPGTFTAELFPPVLN
jgi:hypothetical protein